MAYTNLPKLFQSSNLPGKVVLFGEWAVLEGGIAVSSPIPAYFFATLSRTESPELLIGNGEESHSWTNYQSQAPNDFFKLAWELVDYLGGNYLKIPETTLYGHKIEVFRRWPVEDGLGSSSALFLSLLECLSFLKNKRPVALEWSELLKVYKGFFDGSGIDLATQFYRQSISYQKDRAKALKLRVPSHARLIHCGQKADTQEMIRRRDFSPASLRLIQKATESFLQDGNWKQCVESHYFAQCEMGLIPDSLHESLKDMQRADLITTFKSTGAGGGDAILCLLAQNAESEFEKEISARYWRSRRFLTVNLGELAVGLR